MFSLVSSSSEEGASESVSGGTLVTLERAAPVVATVPAPQHPVQPVPNVPHVAPEVHHAPLVHPKTQPHPPQQHELAMNVPSASPNPSPLPQQTPQPNPQPTVPAVDIRPAPETPAVKVTPQPTIAPLRVAEVTPSARPSATPQPSAAPTSTPLPATPAPTAPPTQHPSSPAPPAPAATARATATPAAQPRPTAVATVAELPHDQPTTSPAKTPGVPAPTITSAPQSTQHGPQATPGPSGPKPGAKAGNNGHAPAPGRVKAPQAPPSPKPPASKPKSTAPDINSKLQDLLGNNNPVKYQTYEQHGNVSVGSTEPTPPPDVVARTKYMYTERGAGSDSRDVMWVTGTHREGPLLICDGWMLRFPSASQPAFKQGTMTNNVSGGIEIHAGGLPGGVLAPIVEENAHISCTQHALVPFAGPPAPSP
ncbi:MAG TPA: hypothetical protein VMF61_05695 [Candidatus Acidoferrales bacterium]|nr:hypothetical protein [Candidatus Acidoferrales bacterium]